MKLPSPLRRRWLRTELGALVLLAVLMTAFVARNLGGNDLVGGDEGYYGVMARNILCGGARYVANPSLSPLGPPGDKPFLYPLILAAAIRVGGVDEIPLRMITLLFAAAIGLLVFMIGREAGEARAGLYGAVLYFTTPLLVYQGRTVAAEPPLIALALAGVWLFLRGLRSRPLMHGLLAGCCMGLAFLCKLWLMFPPLFGVVLGSWLSLRRGGALETQWRDWRRAFIGLVPAMFSTACLQLLLCAVLTPETLPHWLQVYFGFSLTSRLAGTDFAAYWHRPWNFYALTIGRAAALWLPLLAVGFVVLWRRARHHGRVGAVGLSLLLWLLPLVPLSVMSVKSGQYAQPFLPPLLLLAGLGCHDVIRFVAGARSDRSMLVAAMLAGFLALATQFSVVSGSGVTLHSMVPLTIQMAWVVALAGAALWRKPGALTPRLMLVGCLLLVPVAGLARGVQLTRLSDHAVGYALIAERLSPGLRCVEPAEPCFHAPEWPSISFYTFRSGRYWESPYVDPDSAQVVQALHSTRPHFFVVDPGVAGIYGGRPTPPLAALISAEGHPLDLTGTGVAAQVYVNSALWARLTQAATSHGSSDSLRAQ